MYYSVIVVRSFKPDRAGKRYRRAALVLLKIFQCCVSVVSEGNIERLELLQG